MTAASLDFLPMLWLCHWADNLCISLQEYIAPVLMLLAGFMYVTVWGGKKELYIITTTEQNQELLVEILLLNCSVFLTADLKCTHTHKHSLSHTQRLPHTQTPR